MKHSVRDEKWVKDRLKRIEEIHKPKPITKRQRIFDQTMFFAFIFSFMYWIYSLASRDAIWSPPVWCFLLLFPLSSFSQDINYGYVTGFEKQLKETTMFIDSISAYCESLAKMPDSQIEERLFDDGIYDCIIVNKSGIMLMHGYVTVESFAIKNIIDRDGSIWGDGFEWDDFLYRAFSVVVSKRGLMYYVYLYNEE